MLPLGLIQWAGAGFAFALTDFWAVLGLAVFSTALGGTIFLHGMRYIPVQHTSIVGLLEPASAPVFALLFLAERPSLSTLLGGALILVGAVLVVLFGAAEEGLAGSPEEAVGEAGRATLARLRERRTGWRPARRATLPRAHARRDAKARRIRYALTAHRWRDRRRLAQPGRSSAGAAQAREGARRDHPPHLQRDSGQIPA